MTTETVEAFVERVMAARSLAAVRAIADEVAAIEDAQLRRQRLVIGSLANPFFVAQGSGGRVQPAQYMAFISEARRTAAHGEGRRVIVSAPMKSGSTFVSAALASVLRVPKVNLTMQLARPYDHVALGAGARAHEIDEAALLCASLSSDGFVAHHHMLASPYLTGQAALYKLRFVLMKRNIFDCLVSLDDFCRKSLKGQPAEDAYFKMQLPPGWAELDEEARIARLLDRFLHIYVHYFVSWRSLEAQSRASAFWISYEGDILGDKADLAARLGGWLGLSGQEIEALSAHLNHSEGLENLHFNKGVAGRGQAIQGANRDRVLDAFSAFGALADWSEILD